MTADRPDDRRSVDHLRLGAVLLALVLPVFAQSAGDAAADTKIDLVVAPVRFLSHALQLWDPLGNAGQLQNQAYGYLFPIGPFYAALHGVGVAAWEIQRAFESLIVVACFLGTYRVARRLGVDAFWPAVGAGLVYAFAPRLIGELTSISAELMPMAALPWVLLPLLDPRASPRRAAARSGVALLFAGGVNAAATVAILPLPALWLLTRARGPRWRALIGWWVLAVVLACAWWALPLLELGRYSPPFLNWIESSAATTSPTALLAGLRGVDHWESYLGPGVWPGAWILVAAPTAVLATTAVAAAGLAGLADRRTPYRGFLLAVWLLGLILVTLGHAAEIGPPAASTLRHLLDGALVPFRNLHKFDPLIRLPLAIGVGQVLVRVAGLSDVVVQGVRVRARPLAIGMVLAVGAVAVTPVWTDHLVSSARVTPDPVWWREAAQWLGAHSDGTRALVVPGSASPVFFWGGPVDDAIQPVADSPWTVRGAVPLTQPGYIRLLDAIEASLASGAADPSLAPLLARSGIGYVVLANDLDPVASQATPLVYVRATLDDSPGLRLRAGFGQRVGARPSAAVVRDGGGTVDRPAVQIYGVDGGTARAGLDPLAGAIAATGSGDALPQLVHRGLGPNRAVLFGAAANPLAPTRVTTDGIPKQQASFAGSIVPSPTMTATQPYRQDRPVHDYLPAAPGPLSALAYSGISDVTASSSGTHDPWAALDGDPSSFWQSAGFTAVGQWLQVTFPRPVDPGRITVDLATADPTPAPLPTRLTVRTDGGTLIEGVRPKPGPQVLRLPAGATTTLRLTVTAVAGTSDGTVVAIAGLTIPGVTPRRALTVPSLPDSAVYAFDAASGGRADCLSLSVGPVCDPAFAAVGQEDAGLARDVSLAGPATLAVSATVKLRGGTALDRLLDQGNPVQASASSVASDDPRQRPGAAVDGDPGTVWQAAATDAHPVLTLHLARTEAVRQVLITAPRTTAVAAPVTVTVTAGSVRWTGRLPAHGPITLPATAHTDRITIRIDSSRTVDTLSTITGRTTRIAAGIAEVSVVGMPRWTAPATVTLGCAAGPVLAVDTATVRLGVAAARADVLAGRAVPAEPCGPQRLVSLGAGPHSVDWPATAAVQPVSVTLIRPGTSLADIDPAGTMRIEDWGSTHRTVSVATTAAALLVVHENANPGWRATLHGHALTAVMVDGWQQGFVVPAGASGVVTLDFTPQRGFECGLGVGALAALVLLALAGWRSFQRPFDSPPVAVVRRPVVAIVAGTAVAAFLLGGVTGLAIVAAVVLLGGPIRRCGRLVGSLVLLGAGTGVALAGTVHVISRQNSASIQGLALVAIVVTVLAGLDPLPRRRTGANSPRHPDPARRSSGRSSANHDPAATPSDDSTVRPSSTAK